MRIVHVASEYTPFAKVGGLGDVVFSLSKKLAQMGHHLEIILPKYQQINPLIENLSPSFSFSVLEGKEHHENNVYSTEYAGCTLHFIDTNHPLKYFERPEIYGYKDDADRFTYFSVAALEFLYRREKEVDILHLHDWPVSLTTLLAKEIYEPLDFSFKGTLLTLHNLEHQGMCDTKTLSRLGIKTKEERINLLKIGIENADFLSTVSPTYRGEILNTEKGFGLQDLLMERAKKLTGILNGIDYESWDPLNDPYLEVRGKIANKKMLLKELGMEYNPDIPLFCAITRLVHQKGPELLFAMIEKTLALGGQFVLLGSMAAQEIISKFHGLKNPNFRAFFEHDERLAHRLFVSSDAIAIPSLFEPCGLTQLIAMRYGTLPIVRKTGGLADTVFDGINGFTFESATKEAAENALQNAFLTFKEPDLWKKLQKEALGFDSSWDKSALQYEELYQTLMKLNLF